MAGNSFQPMSFAPNYTIPAHTRQQYDDAFNAAIQQEDQRFSSITNVDSRWTADIYTKKQRGLVYWKVNNQRFGKQVAREFEAGNRTGFTDRLTMEPVKFDRTDRARLDTLALPTGPVIQDGMSALNRLRDSLFIASSVADSYGGELPKAITPTVFPSSQVIPVNYVKPGASLGSDSGLHIWKVLRAKNFFRKLGIDLSREELVLAVGYDQPEQLMLSAEAASNEAWAKLTLEWYAKWQTNPMEKLFGFQVIASGDVTATGSTRNCVAFAKRAFCWKPTGKVETKIEEKGLEDNNQIWVGGYAEFGCFREHDELVLKMPSVE